MLGSRFHLRVCARDSLQPSEKSTCTFFPRAWTVVDVGHHQILNSTGQQVEST